MTGACGLKQVSPRKNSMNCKCTSREKDSEMAWPFQLFELQSPCCHTRESQLSLILRNVAHLMLY